MNHFIALSFASHHDAARRLEWRERAFAALAPRNPREISSLQDASELVMVLRDNDAVPVVRHGDGRFMLQMGRSLADTRRRRELAPAELTDIWLGDDTTVPDTLAAPFALCGRRRSGGPFTALADRYGLAHIFGWQGEGVCAIASSALTIGRIFGLDLDLDAVGRFALVGHYLGTSTPVRSVRKCAPGYVFEMSGGRLTTRRAFNSNPAGTPDPDQSVHNGVAALREAVQTHVEAYPGCDIELSGGIDSRLLLSAIPRSQRRRHRAVTLGPSTSDDVRIARLIAGSNGMQHRVVDTTAAAHLELPELLRQLHTASWRHDHAANPIDKLAIESVRDEIGDEPRLSGQNGELARGFYYPGQSLSGEYQPGRVERLLKWRLIGNDSVRADLFHSEYSGYVRQSLRAEVTAQMRSAQYWPLALDRLYLDQRMHRWCGNAVSAAYSQRAILMPFFHPAFVDWALASPPRAKQGSRLACALISELAPELASLPLDTGHTPLQLAQRGPGRKTRSAVTLGHKLVRRVRHRISGTRRHNLGTRSATEMLAGCPLDSVLDRDALCGTGIFERATVDAIAEGRLPADRATLGFLFALQYSIGSLRHPVAPPAPVVVEPPETGRTGGASSKHAA